MVASGKYIAAYLGAITSRRYWIKLGPLGGLFLIKPLAEGIPGFTTYLFWVSIVWLFIVVFWWGYDFLNDELEKRDAEYIQTSPRAREDRAFRLLSKLLREGERTLTGWTPQQIEQWDKEVRATLSQWCTTAALQNYLMYSRPCGQEQLTEPQKALDQLDKIVNFHLTVYTK